MTASLRLPTPVPDQWDWQLQAACRGVDSAVFFPPDNERGRARHRRERAAKRFCGQCPVIEQCAVHALGVQEPYGVWAGMTPAERDDAAGRPRRRSRTVKLPDTPTVESAAVEPAAVESAAVEPV